MMNMAVAFFVCMAFCISVMAFLCSLSDKRKERRWRREDEIAMRRLKRQDEENRRYCEYQKGLIEAIENGKCTSCWSTTGAYDSVVTYINRQKVARVVREKRGSQDRCVASASV